MSQIEANAAMRAYVMGDSGLNQSESTVCINVSHSNLKVRNTKFVFQSPSLTRLPQTKFIELRLDKHMTILEVMEKLRRHTGSGMHSTPPDRVSVHLLNVPPTGVEHTVLQLYNQAQQLVPSSSPSEFYFCDLYSSFSFFL